MLSGCGGTDGPKQWTRDEISDIAGDAAPDTTEFEKKFAELEAENANLKAQLAASEAEVAGLRNDHEALRSLVENNARVQIKIENALRARGVIQ